MTESVTRKLNVVSRTVAGNGERPDGSQWTRYNLEVQDANGKPINARFSSFKAFEPGLTEYTVDTYDGEDGRSYTLKPLGKGSSGTSGGSDLGRRVTKLEERMTAVEGNLETMARTARDFPTPAGVGVGNDEDIPF
jgi:hypothetical protein